jgi:dephospho-CoA kinase
VFAGKPIIGIIGGIGSGKSFVARIFGEMGCLVIDSDQQAHEVLKDVQVKETLREWWGCGVFGADGEIDHAAVGRKVFAEPRERERLEGLLHPRIAQLRDRLMEQGSLNGQIRAFVWDAPLLVEAHLTEQCDAVVFVEAALEVRGRRVWQKRGWGLAELQKRENLQTPLDKKREISDHSIANTADAEFVRSQVREVFSRILAASVSNLASG